MTLFSKYWNERVLFEKKNEIETTPTIRNYLQEEICYELIQIVRARDFHNKISTKKIKWKKKFLTTNRRIGIFVWNKFSYYVCCDLILLQAIQNYVRLQREDGISRRKFYKIWDQHGGRLSCSFTLETTAKNNRWGNFSKRKKKITMSVLWKRFIFGISCLHDNIMKS